MSFKKIIVSLIFFTSILVVILIFNWSQKPEYSLRADPVKSIFINNKNIAETLSELIQFKTISRLESAANIPDPFVELMHYLKKRFPIASETMQTQQLGPRAFVSIWQGSNPDLKPIMFTAHFDVVPDESNSWEQPAFSGHIDGEHIWGRGALDDKSAITAILHSITALLEKGFQPQRSIILAFGGDEEVGGHEGAKKISKFLASKNIELEYLLDEGMPITDGIMKDIEKPIAMIGIAEKGYLNVKLTAKATDGHASTPPKQTAIGVLASAISKLEAKPMKANISGPIGMLFDTLAREMNPLQGIAVSNRWLFEPILEIQLAKQNSTNALIRTTLATTMIQGSQQANVLPSSASATINIRILPGDNIEKVLSHIKETINEPSIEIAVIDEPMEPTQLSNINNSAYKAISTSIAQVFPNVLVAPSLLIASTDTKHYKQFTHNIYRFRPLWIKPEDINRFHGSNERISKQNLEQMTMFYYQLILNSNEL